MIRFCSAPCSSGANENCDNGIGFGTVFSWFSTASSQILQITNNSLKQSILQYNVCVKAIFAGGGLGSGDNDILLVESDKST